LYEAATAETDLEKLRDLVYQVEEALTKRAMVLAERSNHRDERDAMVKAHKNLLVIKCEKLGFPPIDKTWA
jgi:hypothetical protein